MTIHQKVFALNVLISSMLLDKTKQKAKLLCKLKVIQQVHQLLFFCLASLFKLNFHQMRLNFTNSFLQKINLLRSHWMNFMEMWISLSRLLYLSQMGLLLNRAISFSKETKIKDTFSLKQQILSLMIKWNTWQSIQILNHE